MGARHVYLLALASKIHERGSPRRGTLRYSNRCWWPSVDGVNSLSWSFIGIPCKPSYSAFFSNFGQGAVPGSSPGGSRVIRRGDGVDVLGENLFNYRYRERLETDSVAGKLVE